MGGFIGSPVHSIRINKRVSVVAEGGQEEPAAVIVVASDCRSEDMVDAATHVVRWLRRLGGLSDL